MRRKLTMTLTLALAALVALVFAQEKKEAPQVLFGAAVHQQEAEGNFKEAIRLYEAVLKSYGSDRKLAAVALMRMAECYQKLGSAEARKALERLVRDFADQKETVAEARLRLAAMGGEPSSRRLTTERVSDLDWPDFNLAMDRPLFTSTDWATGDLMLHDILAGETRNLTKNGPAQKAKEFAQTSVISADGQMVLYGWDEGYPSPWSEIRSINSDGTGMRTHLRRTARTEYLSPVALSPDKKIAIVELGNHVEVLSLADNSLKPFGEGLRFSEASFSPDGRQTVFSGTGPRGDSGLFLANADGGGLRPLLTEKVTSPLWTPDGRWIVFVSDRTGSKAVWAVPPSGGDPRLLKGDQGISELHGFTRGGSLYYSTSVNQLDVYVAQLDTATLAIKGEPSKFINTFLGRNRTLNFSPDGKWVVWASARGREQAQSVILRAAAGGEEKEMPLPMVTYAHPRVWFPDSKALLNRRVDGGQVILERVEVPDGRITELYRSAPLNGVLGPAAQVVLFAVASDGNALLGYRCDRSRSKPCELVRYDSQKKSETVVETLSEINAISSIAISRDGKWLAVIGNPGSGSRLLVKPVSGGKLVELVRGTDTEGLQGEIVWTPDSKQIIYAVWAPSRGMWSTQEFRAIPVEGGAPRIIPLKGGLSGLDPVGRLAYTVNSTRNELWVVHNLLPSN